MFPTVIRRPALLIGAAMLAAAGAPIAAQSAAPFFTATLASPAAEARFAAGGVVWRCEGTECRAARITARPLRVCTGLHREAGAITNFSAGGSALSAEELARCNR